MPSRSRGAPAGARKQLSASARGLDGAHRTNRTRLMARHVNGKRCWWCGRPMFDDNNYQKNWDGCKLHADHSKSRSKHGIGRTHADRLLHDTCNKQRGDGTRDDQRPALLAQTQTQPATPQDLGALAMPWPEGWTA